MLCLALMLCVLLDILAHALLYFRQGRGPKQRLREEPLADEQRGGRKDGKKREGGKFYSSSLSPSGSKQKVDYVFVCVCVCVVLHIGDV